MKNSHYLALGLLAAGLCVTTVNTVAQGAGGRGGGGAGGGGRGNFDPAEMRARMEERIKTQLKASDEEWKIIQPLLEKVQTAQRENTMGRFGGMGMMFGGRGGGPGGPPDAQQGQDTQRRQRPQAAGSDDMEALQKALESESTPAAEIKAKLQAVRDERKKQEQALKVARDDLRKVLTTRQEAQLVLMGMLD